MNRLLLLLLIVPIGVTGSAQKLFDLGLKGGVSKDEIRMDNVASAEGIVGWHFGAFFRVKPPLAPGVQLEALYNSMGTDVMLSDSLADDSEVRLQYLQAPLFLVFSLGPAELHVGGYASHLLNASIRHPQQVQSELVALRANQFLDTDYGLLGGVGFDLGQIYLGARYTIGLGTIGASDNAILRDARNSQFQFYLGIGFNK